MLLVLLVMTKTILWTPQDTRSSKKRQRSKSFSNFIYKNTEGNILFTQTRSSESKLVRARSHLNYFTKCLQKNVYPQNLDIKPEHFNIAFATNDIKESLCQLDQKTITKKMSLCITHFKLKVIELEGIAIHKNKLRHICDGERLTFLQNKFKQFKDKLYKELEKKKHKFNFISIFIRNMEYAKSMIPDLNLTNQDRLNIRNNEEIDDFIILQAMNLLQKQYPTITTQPPLFHLW